MNGENKYKDKRRYLKHITIVLVIILILSSVLFFLSIWEKQRGRFPEQTTEMKYLEHNGIDYVLKDNVETMLMLGLDKFEEAVDNTSYNNDMQADFIMLIVIDNENKTYDAIHINRDTMAKINVLGLGGKKIDTVTKQIALSHTYGNGKEISCRNASDSVSSLLFNVKIKHYLSLTMDSVTVLNDLVGGVEVTVLDDFTGIDDSLVKGETMTLHGNQALTYVRSRQGLEDSTNNARMNRQRQYLTSLQNKVSTQMKADEEFAVNASLKMADYLVSDCSATLLQTLFEKISDFEFGGIYYPDGNFKVNNDLMEFYPDEDSLKDIVVNLLYEPK